MKLNLQEQEGIVSDLERRYDSHILFVFNRWLYFGIVSTSNGLKCFPSRIEELQLTASDSDKLSSIVKEKNSQIAILRKNLDEYQTNSTQLETKYVNT